MSQNSQLSNRTGTMKRPLNPNRRNLSMHEKYLQNGYNIPFLFQTPKKRMKQVDPELYLRWTQILSNPNSARQGNSHPSECQSLESIDYTALPKAYQVKSSLTILKKKGLIEPLMDLQLPPRETEEPHSTVSLNLIQDDEVSVSRKVQQYLRQQNKKLHQNAKPTIL